MIAATVLVLSLVTSSPAESLRTVATATGAALAKGNWEAFRRHAASTIWIDEYWVAYDDYFTNLGRKVRKGLSSQDGQWIASSTRIENTRTLSAKAGNLFKSFCQDVKQSYGLGRGDKPWPQLSKDCKVE